MEDTLRGKQGEQKWREVSLNPCSNGRYSQSLQICEILRKGSETVLILVLMEDTLRGL